MNDLISSATERAQLIPERVSLISSFRIEASVEQIARLTRATTSALCAFFTIGETVQQPFVRQVACGMVDECRDALEGAESCVRDGDHIGRADATAILIEAARAARAMLSYLGIAADFEAGEMARKAYTHLSAVLDAELATNAEPSSIA
jgi:hypothetical protein